MTLYDEIKQGLQSGIDAYNEGKELKSTTVSSEDQDDINQDKKESVRK